MTTTADPFALLAGEEFAVLTTYRRSGEAMPTTVWFAAHDGKVYITTNERAGKVKRIRANPQVTLAASDRIGTIHGPAVPGHARLLSATEASIANEALHAKYGDVYANAIRQMDAGGTNGSRVFIEVRS
jgi:hypothetical protein